MANKTIDMAEHINKNFTALVGRESAESLLKKLSKGKLDFSVLEEKNDKIIIKIPPKIITMNKSFFLGLFETRIQALGKDKFKEKYEFETTDHIKNKVAIYLDTALLSASMEDIING